LDNLLAAQRLAAVVLVRNAAAGALKLVPLATIHGDDPRTLYLAATMPVLLSAVGVLAALPRLVPGYRLRAPVYSPAVRQVVAFAIRTFPGALLSGAPQFALPLIAVYVLGAREYAFFYVAWSIAQILYLVPSVVANIALSEGSVHSGTGEAGSVPAHALIARARRFSLLLLAPACLVGAALTGVVLRLYGGPYVGGAGWPLRLLVLAALPWTVVMLAQTQLRIEHRFAAVTVLTGAFCVASLGLPLVLAVPFRTLGMAAGWLATVTATAGVAWRVSDQPGPRRRGREPRPAPRGTT
jgi:O-antigen/teichoic acid export membrane protein